jgi:hydrogenase expression/formation protein HypC
MCLAIPGRITAFQDEGKHMATVDVSGVRRQVNVDLLQDSNLQIDDWVLIHVGFAMSKISEQQAKEQLDLLAMLGESDEAMAEVDGYQFADDAPLERHGSG